MTQHRAVPVEVCHVLAEGTSTKLQPAELEGVFVWGWGAQGCSMGYSWATDSERLLQRLEVPAETPDMQHCHVNNWGECGTKSCFLRLQVELKPRQSTTRDLKQVLTA